MGVKAELSDFLNHLPAVDSPDERKALLTFTGPSELGIYLDWQGSNVAFTERLLEELGRRGKETLSGFLAALPNAPQVASSLERQQQVAALHAQVDALDGAAFHAEFSVPLPVSAPAERPPADPAMLAAAVVNDVLVPYYKLGADQLRQKAGGRAVTLAEAMAEEVEQQLSGDVAASAVLGIFQKDPEAGQAGILQVLKSRLEGDPALAGELATLFTSAAAEPERGGLQALVQVSQEIGQVRGDVVGAVLGAEVVDKIEKLFVSQHVTTVEEGGTLAGITAGASEQISIDQFMAHVERGDVIGVQQIFNVMEQDEAAQDRLVAKIVERLKLEGLSVTQLGAQPLPENIDHQIQNVISAQKEVAARGLQASPETLLRMGKLAAYRRDYEEAVSYFRQASQADPGYEAAWEAIVWLQQARAMHDIKARDYDAAVGKLAEARSAADHTDPLDPRALALRGYIAKTLAQIAKARGNQSARQEYLEEAERFYSHVSQLDPREPGAWNGLGNVRAMLGDHDAAIESYERAIELAPNYTAAYHDLGISYQAKMTADPDRREEWYRKALHAWQNAYKLAPMDPSFSEQDVVDIGRRVQMLESVVNKSGGAYIGGDAQVGGDLVGRDQRVHGDQVRGDKIVIIHEGTATPPETPLIEEAIRLDVAAPPSAILDLPFDLGVAVRRPDAPPLTVDDLTETWSEGGSVFRHEGDEVVLYRVAVSATGCDVVPSHYVLKLRPQANSRICWFQITAHRPGRRSILVTAYQEDDALAAQTRLSIEVHVPVAPDG